MAIRAVRTIWGFDSKWIRVELFDDSGQPLGVVRYEPNRCHSRIDLLQTFDQEELWYDSLRGAALALVRVLAGHMPPSRSGA